MRDWFEPFKEICLFWFPDNFDQKFSGELIFDPDESISVNLSTLVQPSSIQNLERNVLFSRTDLNILLCVSDSGSHYTIFDRTGSGSTSSSGWHFGIKNLGYNHLIEGALWDSINEILVKQLRFQFNGLKWWLKPNNVKVKWEDDYSSFTAKVKKRTRINLAKIDGISIFIDETHNLFNRLPIERFILHSSPMIVISSNKYITFNNIYNYYIKTLQLFSILFNQSAIPGYLNGTFKQGKHIMNCNIYHRCTKFSREPKFQDLSLIFDYNDLKPNINEIVVNWMSMYSKLLPFIEQYFIMILFSEKLHLDQLFINLIISLDSLYYHCTKIRKRKEAKLENLFKDVLDNFNELFINVHNSKYKQFTDEIIIQRGQYAHRRKAKSRGENRIHEFTMFIECLINILLLNEFGLNKDTIINKISKYFVFERIINYINLNYKVQRNC